MSRQATTVVRDVRATEIPSGRDLVLAAGTRLMVTQALGGTFTVMTDRGFLARIDGKDADAIGREPPAPAAERPAPSGAPASASDLEKQVWDVLRTVYDPEIPVNVVELGLIYLCELKPAEAGQGTRVEIAMTMTAPGCGMGDVIAGEIEQKLRALPGIAETRVEIVFDPPWDPSLMSEAARLECGLM